LWKGLGAPGWMSANHVDEAQLNALLEDEARVAWIQRLAAFDAGGYLLDQLRVSGDYPRLVERARHKQAVLAERGQDEATPADTGLEEGELLRWYFEDRLGRPVPADLDGYCAEMGFSGGTELRRSVAREFCFVNGYRAGMEIRS